MIICLSRTESEAESVADNVFNKADSEAETKSETDNFNNEEIYCLAMRRPTTTATVIPGCNDDDDLIPCLATDTWFFLKAIVVSLLTIDLILDPGSCSGSQHILKGASREWPFVQKQTSKLEIFVPLPGIEPMHFLLCVLSTKH